MISEEINKSKVIDLLIRQNRSFAIYRIPGEEKPRFVMQSSGSSRLLFDIEALNGQSGFVIAPFQVSADSPILLIQPDCFAIPEDIPEDCFLEKHLTAPEESRIISEDNLKAAYTDCFRVFIKPLQEKRFDKLVLSRSLTADKEADFSPAQAFFKACERYIRSYVYLCHTPETGTWLGSTPEIILSGENKEWHTVALAGTQPLQHGELPVQWDDKNREEQGIVAAYIRSQLLSFGIQPVENSPYAARAGELSHLKSDFRFSLSDNNKLGDLLNLLHPTPAVCGLPKEDTYRFILKNEGYNRRYYSGFIGEMNPEGKTNLYVNLRCMHIARHTLTLYAGGGLLASSRLEDEWQETKDKLQTMLRLLLKFRK